MNLLFLFVFSHAWAADIQPVVVEAPRILDESIEASRAVNVLDEEEIRLKKKSNVADLLRELPGVDVVRQGSLGQTTSIYIRGARSEDTLVLIDGVEANDSLSPSGAYDFSALSPENIERIEVYRGPQSVRFGGGALGGVINIVTREGKGALKGHYLTEGGSYDSLRATGGVSGQKDSAHYSLVAEGFQTHGFSAASRFKDNKEADGAKIGTLSGKFVWRNTTSSVATTLRLSKANLDWDRRGGAGGDDPNDTAETSQLLTGIMGETRFLDDQLKSSLGFYYSEITRFDSNPPDEIDNTQYWDSFLSENEKVDSNHEWTIDDRNTLRLNLMWRRQTGASSQSLNGVHSFFSRQEQSDFGQGLTYLYESPTWFGDVGVRFNQHSVVGTIPSERASIGRAFSTGTRVSLTYGTGYKVPSLYQLYSNFGSPSLQKENSSAWDFAIEQKFTASFEASIGYFRNQFENMIDFNPAASRYENIASAKSSGVELQTTLSLTEHWKLKSNYTYMEAIDNTTGLPLARRARNAANLGLRYQDQNWEGFFEGRYKDVRPDIDPTTFIRTTDDAYVVFNLGAAYAFSPSFKIHGRIENLFDQRYEEVAGYGTPELSYFIGLSGTL